MKDILKKLMDAARQHGEDSDPDHEVGDLQDLLVAAWELLPLSAKAELLDSAVVENVLEGGFPSDYDEVLEQLQESLEARVVEMEAVVEAAGYSLEEGEDGFRYLSEDEVGIYFRTEKDALEDIHRTLTQGVKHG